MVIERGDLRAPETLFGNVDSLRTLLPSLYFSELLDILMKLICTGQAIHVSSSAHLHPGMRNTLDKELIQFLNNKFRPAWPINPREYDIQVFGNQLPVQLYSWLTKIGYTNYENEHRLSFEDSSKQVDMRLCLTHPPTNPEVQVLRIVYMQDELPIFGFDIASQGDIMKNQRAHPNRSTLLMPVDPVTESYHGSLAEFMTDGYPNDAPAVFELQDLARVIRYFTTRYTHLLIDESAIEAINNSVNRIKARTDLCLNDAAVSMLQAEMIVSYMHQPYLFLYMLYKTKLSTLFAIEKHTIEKSLNALLANGAIYQNKNIGHLLEISALEALENTRRKELNGKQVMTALYHKELGDIFTTVQEFLSYLATQDRNRNIGYYERLESFATKNFGTYDIRQIFTPVFSS